MANLWINRSEMDKFFNKIANEIAEEARQRVPVAQGQLHDSIKVVGNNRVVADAVDVNGQSYASSVEFGRSPGTMPPYGPNSRLAIWAGTPGRAVKMLARAIAERGIAPKPFFFSAVQIVAARHFKNVRAR